MENIIYSKPSKGLPKPGDPTIEWSDGTKEWWKNNKFHRIYGPAIIAPYRVRWYINGTNYTKSKHNRLVLFYTLEPQRIDLI